MEDEDWKEVYWVRNGKNRMTILKLLDDAGRPFTSTEIAEHEDTDISMNSAAISLREMAEHDLTECINPEANRNRAYRITDKGRNVVEKLDELL